jgi:hypothetical protein
MKLSSGKFNETVQTVARPFRHWPDIRVRLRHKLCGIDAPPNPTWLSSDLSVSDRLQQKQRLHDMSP